MTAVGLNMGTAMDALHAWVAEQSGVGVGHCVWADEPGPVPSYPWARLKLISGPTGGPVVAERRHRSNPNPADPNDVQLGAHRHQRLTLSIQVATRREASEPFEASKRAHQRLLNVAASLDLIGVRQALREAGLVVRELGPKQDLSEVRDDAFFERWQMDVFFGCVVGVSETTTSIESVRVTSEIVDAAESLQLDDEELP